MTAVCFIGGFITRSAFFVYVGKSWTELECIIILYTMMYDRDLNDVLFCIILYPNKKNVLGVVVWRNNSKNVQINSAILEIILLDQIM